MFINVKLPKRNLKNVETSTAIILSIGSEQNPLPNFKWLLTKNNNKYSFAVSFIGGKTEKRDVSVSGHSLLLLSPILRIDSGYL